MFLSAVFTLSFNSPIILGTTSNLDFIAYTDSFVLMILLFMIFVIGSFSVHLILLRALSAFV